MRCSKHSHLPRMVGVNPILNSALFSEIVIPLGAPLEGKTFCQTCTAKPGHNHTEFKALPLCRRKGSMVKSQHLVFIANSSSSIYLITYSLCLYFIHFICLKYMYLFMAGEEPSIILSNINQR